MGTESCRISDIKKYRSKSRSVSFSQILPRDYSYDEAKTVITEMAYHGSLELMKRQVITKKVWVGIGYSKNMCESTAATAKLFCATAVPSKIKPAAVKAFETAAVKGVPIRRLAISFNDVCDEGCEGYDLFTDWNSIERKKLVNRPCWILQRVRKKRCAERRQLYGRCYSAGETI